MKTLILLPLVLCLLLPATAAEEEKPKIKKVNINRLLRRTVCSNGVMSLAEAVIHGKWDVLDQRIAEGFNLNETDAYGNTALHYAVQLNRVKGVRRLIHAGANPSILNKAGKAPHDLINGDKIAEIFKGIQEKREVELKLAKAINDNKSDLVQKLLNEQKVNPNAESNKPNESMLMLAVKLNKATIAEMLLKAGADVNKKNSQGMTALNIAAVHGRTDIVKILLNNGADVTIADNRKVYPLTNASWGNHFDTIKVLLPHYKEMNFNPPAGNGVFPAARAIRQRQHHILKLLLDSGMKIEDPTFRDAPLLILATQVKNEEAVRMLIQAGADLNIKDTKGKTARDYANATIAPLLKP